MYTHMYSQCMQHPLIQRPDWTTEMPDTAPGVRIFDAPLLVRARRETLVPSGDPLASLGRHGPNTSRNRHSLCNRTRLSIVMARVSPPRSPRAPGEIPVSKRSTPPRYFDVPAPRAVAHLLKGHAYHPACFAKKS